MAKFILGGRMGDLIHMMYVVANTPGKHDLYITDRRDLHSDGFVYDLARTVEELKPILLYQDYVNSVQAYNDEPDCINLNMWRRKAYSASWTNLLSEMFNVPVNGEAWMMWPTFYKTFNKKLLHKSIYPARNGDWSKVNTEEFVDIGNSFPTLESLFVNIKMADFFIGEQSLPFAVACALDIPRIAVLNHVDKAAYIGEELIFKNFSYVL